MDPSRPLIIYSCTWIVYWKFRTSGNLFLYLAKQNPIWEANSSSFGENNFPHFMEQYFQLLFTSYPEQQNHFSAPPSCLCSRTTPKLHVLKSLPKGTAKSEPDKTNTTNRHLSGHTSPDMCDYFNPTCLSRHLAAKVLFLRLLIVGDTTVTWCTRLMMSGTNVCWWVIH
jgi:hypothetical protein